MYSTWAQQLQQGNPIRSRMGHRLVPPPKKPSLHLIWLAVCKKNVPTGSPPLSWLGMVNPTNLLSQSHIWVTTPNVGSLSQVLRACLKFTAEVCRPENLAQICTHVLHYLEHKQMNSNFLNRGRSLERHGTQHSSYLLIDQQYWQCSAVNKRTSSDHNKL